MIAGEISISMSSPAASFIQQLGGEQRGAMWYLPVEVGYLAEADASTGDIIFDGYQRYRTDNSVWRVVSWAVTCRRGEQDLVVGLRNGEKTETVKVVNEFMNKVDDLKLQGAPESGIQVEVKKSVTGFRVIGSGAQLERRFWPDLTNRDKCLDLAIGNPDTASVDRGATLTVNGIEKGDTTLELLLIGSADSRTNAPEIQRSIPVKVTGQAGPLFQQRWTTPFYNKWWNVTVDLSISSSNGTLSMTNDSTFNDLRMFDFTTAGGTFTITASVSGISKRDGQTPGNLLVKGTLSSSGNLVPGTTFSRTVTIQPGAKVSERSTYLQMAIYQTGDGGESWLAGDNVFRVQFMIQ